MSVDFARAAATVSLAGAPRHPPLTSINIETCRQQ